MFDQLGGCVVDGFARLADEFGGLAVLVEVQVALLAAFEVALKLRRDIGWQRPVEVVGDEVIAFAAVHRSGVLVHVRSIVHGSSTKIDFEKGAKCLPRAVQAYAQRSFADAEDFGGFGG